MKTRTTPVLALVAGLAVAALATPLTAGAATVPPPTPGVVLSLNSTYDPAYASGEQVFADQKGATLDGNSNLTTGITVRATHSGGDVTVTLQPPTGKKLQVGHYTGLNSNVNDDSKAKGSVAVGSTDYGWYGDADVLALSANASGRITGFDVVFGNNAASSTNSLFGEVRLGQPATGAVTLAAKNLEWPVAPKKSTPIKATEWVHNTSAAKVAVGTLSVGGAAAADYRLSANTCAGKTLAPGAKCSVVVGFSPLAGGPRNATLIIPITGSTQTVSLSGTAPLGTSSITLSGDDYVSGGVKHTFAEGPFQIIAAPQDPGYVWAPTAPYGIKAGQPENTVRVGIAAPGGGVLKVGTHKTVSFLAGDSTLYGQSTDGFARGCSQYRGSIAVKAFAVDAQNNPTLADVWIAQYCDRDGTHAMSERVVWQVRADVTAPTRVGSLAATSKGVSWTASASADRAQTIVRLIAGSGAGATPTSGVGLYAGTGTSVRMPALVKGQTYTVAAYVVDKTGNVSGVKAVQLRG